MPVVPRRTQQLRNAPVPTTQVEETAPIESFGGGAGFNRAISAGQNLLGTVADIAAKEAEFKAKEKLKADELAVLDADLQLAQRQTAREQEIGTFKGKAALTAPDKITPSWQSDIVDIRSSLSTDEQRAAFDRKIYARNNQISEKLGKHVSTELDRFDQEQSDAYIANAQTEAQINAYDPNRIQASLEQQIGAIKQRGAHAGEPEELITKKIFAAARTTHLGVVDRMIADESWDDAEAYLTANKSILTGDQVRLAKSQIESGKKQAIDRNKVDQSELERELYLKTMDGQVGLKDIHSLLEGGQIDVPFYDKLRSRIVKVNDDPEIPTVEKTNKLFDILKRYDDLNGTSVELDAQKVTSRSKGNRLDELKEFRTFVAENAPYLTRRQEEAFYKLTQRDYDDATAGKIGVFRRLFSYLSNAMGRNPGAVAPIAGPILSQAMEAFDPSVPVSKAAEQAATLKEQATVAINPNRAKYQVGQVLAAGSSVDFNGRTIVIPSTMSVIGFDEDGTPIVDAVK